jgi:hypothetical protein
MGEDEDFGPPNEEKQQEEVAEESPTEQTEERPIGVEEQETIEEQEKSTIEPEPTTTTPLEIVETVLEPKTNQKGNQKGTKAEREEEVNTRRLFDQFNKHFQVSKIASDKTTNILKQIQKQLGQVERISINSNKQQVVIKQLVGQVKTVQKQLDKISKSISSKKMIPSVKRKTNRGKK